MIKLSYLHPLDYIGGLKHYLTDRKVNVIYEVTPQSFIVYEKIDWSDLGFSKDKGEYAVIEVYKKAVDTLSAIRIISSKLKVPQENIIFLGFKDKYSTSTQFFFIRRTLIHGFKIDDLSSGNVNFKLIGYVNRKPRGRHLLGNKFMVLIEASNRVYDELLEITRLINQNGLPSYYGYQRFGYHRPCTHIIGKYLLLGRLDLFSKTLLNEIFYTEGFEATYKRLRRLYESFFYEYLFSKTRDIRKAVEFLTNYTKGIYLDSYVAYLYNLLLNIVVEKEGWLKLNELFPTIGCIDYFETYYSEIAEIEGLSKDIAMKLKCWFRKGLFYPNVTVSKAEGFVTLDFELPKGFYASVVLREVFKDNLIIPILHT